MLWRVFVAALVRAETLGKFTAAKGEGKWPTMARLCNCYWRHMGRHHSADCHAAAGNTETMKTRQSHLAASAVWEMVQGSPWGAASASGLSNCWGNVIRAVLCGINPAESNNNLVDCTYRYGLIQIGSANTKDKGDKPRNGKMMHACPYGIDALWL